MQKNIGIQGFEGSFHHEAAERYFGKDISIVPFASFHTMAQKLGATDSSMQTAVMAIENSNAGSILQNYHLLHKFDLEIKGEIYLPIHQNLMVLPGVKLESLTHVQSHPMAIHQSRSFFDDKPQLELVETADTALSAKSLRDNNWQKTGAIASARAAELYDLEIIAPKIETDKNNYTRFWVLKKTHTRQSKPIDFNKASLLFYLPHDTGSLAKVLTRIAAAGVNLTKIQSVPSQEENWRYHFYVDMVFETPALFEKCIESIKGETKSLKILGTYTNQENK